MTKLNPQISKYSSTKMKAQTRNQKPNKRALKKHSNSQKLITDFLHKCRIFPSSFLQVEFLGRFGFKKSAENMTRLWLLLHSCSVKNREPIPLISLTVVSVWSV